MTSIPATKRPERRTSARVCIKRRNSGTVIGMTYSAGRITNLTLNSSPLISAINYFPLGGPESWLLGANTTGIASYIRTIDLNSRVSQYSIPTGYKQLTFDNASRITAIGSYLGNSTTATTTQTFGYDNAGRLSSFNGDINNGNTQPNVNQTQYFGYDANGNRTVAILQGINSTFSYSAGSNRLTSVTGNVNRNNLYDAAGNLTTDGTNTYSYDARGRMTNAIAGGLNTNYLINYQNLRVKKTNSSETAHFVYDDAGHMLGEYNASGTVVNELVWLGDTLVAVRGTMPCLAGGACTETATAYVWSDHLNTPRELTRVNGSNVHVSMWKWDSLPFGETAPNANPSNLGVMKFNHRFPGQYRDSETELSNNWHRDYDPLLGRYVESDPLGLKDGANTYAYVHGSPVSSTDRTGLYWEYCSGAGTMYHVNNQTGARTSYGSGFAGNGTGTNNVAQQCTKDTGPLPAGTYDMKNVATPDYGKNGIQLTPRDKSKMCNRFGFWIHAGLGASNGCIDLSSADSLAAIVSGMKDMGDTELRVVGICQ